ncbi:MAG: helix-turn-helix transcriptional regulator [Acidobacteriota bacterium]|nr:helix-turn-helix transcriptional regulator [Acidobacteriota bacterium]
MFLFSEFSRWVGETGLTQKEIAKKLNVSRSFLNSVMVGKSEPNTQFLDLVHQVANEGAGYLKWCFYDPGLLNEHSRLAEKVRLKLLLQSMFERAVRTQIDKRESERRDGNDKVRGWVRSVVEGSLLAFKRNLERNPEDHEDILKESEVFLTEQVTNMFRFVTSEKEEAARFEEVFPPEQAGANFPEEIYVNPETKRLLST